MNQMMNIPPRQEIGLSILFLLLILWSMPVWVFAEEIEIGNVTEILAGFDQEEKRRESIDELLEGFDKSPAAQKAIPQRTRTSHFHLSGWFKLAGTYNFAHHAPEEGETDWRGLSRLRPELLLEGDLRLPDTWRLFVSGKGFYDFAYALNGRDDYTDEVLDEYEHELELREAFLAGRLTDSVDLKLGRQIFVWGRSDNLRVTDVLNPLDQREPGLTDIEDLRLPVTMVRLDGHNGPWTLTGLVIPEIRFDKTPVYGHDFYPSDQPLPSKDRPDEGFGHAEYGAALNGVFSGWDISFYGARFYDDQFHLVLNRYGELFRKHSRLTMFGVAGTWALGNFLLFGEAAWFDGLEFFNTDGSFSRTDLLAGVEYSGFRDTTISFEILRQHLNGFDRRLAEAPDEATENLSVAVLRLSRTFMHERLTLTALAYNYGLDGDEGALQRLQGAYDLRDGLTMTVGVVLFKSGDLPVFRSVADNDRFFAEVKWSF